MMVTNRNATLNHFQSLGIGVSVGPQPMLPYEEGEGELMFFQSLDGNPITNKYKTGGPHNFRDGNSQIGDCQLEIYPMKPGPGMFISEYLEKKGSGINHIAFNTDDIERDTKFFTEKGCQLVFNVSVNGKTIENYLDTRKYGDVMISLRPTSSKLREVLFNWIQFEIHNLKCLDLFAGTGSLGIEAISRGANSTVFIESNKKNYQMLSVDYSQIELRVLAHLSKEENLVKAFNNGEDIHNSTAKLMYETNDVNSEQRRIAKILNFGVLYGLGPHGVAQQTDLSREQGKQFIDLYFGKYPGIKDFQKLQIDNSKKTGYSKTLLGRRRYLEDINSPNARIRGFAERIAINMPIQGTAAEIIKVAMIKLGQKIRYEGMRSKMLVQVHDELIFEVAPGELMELGSMINEIMPEAIKLDVPVLVDIKTGSSWGSLE